MATIKPRRGSSYPASGLSENELAVDTTNRRVYLGSAGGSGITVASHITDYVTTFNGSTGAITGVSSVNGLTGAVTNVAFTNAAQTFTQGQTFNTSTNNTVDIIGDSNGIALRVASSGQGRVGGIRLGRASTTALNSYIYQSDGTFYVFAGATAAGSSIAIFEGSTASLTLRNNFGRVDIRSFNVPSDATSIRLWTNDGDVGAYYSDIVAPLPISSNTTNTLPSTTGTLLNTTSSYVSGICGATGAITLSAGTGITISRSSGTFTITNIGVSSVNGSTGTVGISAGSNVTITQTGNTYTIASGGLSWSAVTADRSLVAEEGVLANKSSGTLTLTLPTTAALGKVIRVSGMQNTWRIAQNASQKIHFGKITTTTGVGGYLENSNAKDAVELVCCVADLEWNVISSIGNITIV